MQSIILTRICTHSSNCLVIFEIIKNCSFGALLFLFATQMPLFFVSLFSLIKLINLNNLRIYDKGCLTNIRHVGTIIHVNHFSFLMNLLAGLR